MLSATFALWMASAVPVDAAMSDCNAPLPSVAATNLRAKVTIDPYTLWQPRGGTVKFTIEVQPGAGGDTSLVGASVLPCFGWRLAGGSAERFFPSPEVSVVALSPTKITYAATVPDALPSAPDRWHFSATDANEPTGAYTGVWTVPLADLRIIATGATLTTPVDVTRPIGVTRVFVALVLAILSVVLAFCFLYTWRGCKQIKGGNILLKLIATRKGYASLSQLQIILWTFLVGASAIYVMTLSGNLIEISNGTLVLLGITGTAVLGSKLQSNVEDKNASALSAAPAPPQALASAQAPDGVLPPARVAEADLPHVPRWSDLLISDGEIDVSRVQMLFFTVITAVFVGMKVLNSYTIPEIPESFLILMGISNGVYITNKYV
jgi:hypothetical protein